MSIPEKDDLPGRDTKYDEVSLKVYDSVCFFSSKKVCFG